MYKISTLNKISPAGLALFNENYTISDDLDSANGILVRSQDMLNMDFSKNLMAIARAGAGVNNIPLDRCAEQGIVVFNTPGANANAVAELVIGMMILEARNLFPALEWTESFESSNPDITKIVEKEKGQYAGHEIKGKKICIIGLGSIGVLLANTCEALGMNVVGYAPYMSVKAAHNMSNTIPFTTNLPEALQDSDYVSVHVPANERTAGMVNAGFINMMKDGATLLNFARDKIVDEKLVIEALSSGKLRRYITDFPTPTNTHKKGVLHSPHLGASTMEAEDNCALAAVTSLISYLEDGNIENSVNFPACNLGAFVHGNGKSRICILNKNVPAILGKITGILANENINIDNMINKSKGHYAYTVIEADAIVDEESLLQKLNTDGIIKVRVIN